MQRPTRPSRRAVVIVVAAALMWPAAGAAVASTPSPSPAARTLPTPALVGKGPRVSAFPKIVTGSFVLVDATTGRILAARLPHAKRPPASTLKTLTALTLIPQLDPSGRYTAVPADVRVSGSRVGLVPGSSYTHDQLFTGLFLPSGNDAAAALARANGGMGRTVRQMNLMAHWLRADDTVAKNSSGLDAPGQVSSAYDLALIAREGLKNPVFAHYAGMARTSFPGREPKRAGQKRSSFVIETQNRLLRDGYPGMIGVKTGYTTNAGRTYIGAAQRGGMRLIVTMMGNAYPTEITAKHLLDWGFANDAKVTTAVGMLVEPDGPAPDLASTDRTDRPADTAQHNADASPINAATTSSSLGASSVMLRWMVLALALATAIGLVMFAYVGNGSLARRRIRRRYHR